MGMGNSYPDMAYVLCKLRPSAGQSGTGTGTGAEGSSGDSGGQPFSEK